MKKGFILLAVPVAPADKWQHPGGQLTAARGLLDYMDYNGVPYRVLNTLASSYPRTKYSKKILDSFRRVVLAAYYLFTGGATSYVAFSGFGASLYERCFIALLFRLFGKPSVVFFRSSEIFVRRLSNFQNFILRFVLRAPSQLVSQSSALANRLEAMIKKSVKVIPNWLPPDIVASQVPKSRFADELVSFVFVGWLETGKGVLDLLSAIKSIKVHSHRFRVQIVGDGSLRKFITEFVVDNELKNVAVHGWLDHRGVLEVLRDSHVFVLPSYSEGFPNSLLEAAAVGLPVISCPVGGIPDFLIHRHNGFLVEAGDVSSLASAMLEYVLNVELVLEHSTASLSRVAEFHNYSNNCRALLDLIRDS